MGFAGLDDKIWDKSTDEIIEALKALPDKTIRNEHGETLLHKAIWKDPAVVRYLLEAGADPNQEDNNGLTPLHEYADPFNTPVYYNEIESFLKPLEQIPLIINAFLDHKANPQRKDKQGLTPYLRAARILKCRYLEVMASRNVTMNRSDSENNTGLHLAHRVISPYARSMNELRTRYYKETIEPDEYSESQKKEATRLMENQREKLNTVMEAAMIAVKAFMENGVDPEQLNSDGKTAFELFGQDRLPALCALVKGTLTGEDTPEEKLRLRAGGMTLQKAALWGMPDAIEALLELGADINSFDEIENGAQGTALAAACRAYDLEAAELLLKKGIDPNLKTGDGLGAFAWFFAAENRFNYPIWLFKKNIPGKIVKAMKEAGFDINGKIDGHENTPLSWACSAPNGDSYPNMSGAGSFETYRAHDSLRLLIIKALLKEGADPNRSNRYGQTPLMFACGSFMDNYPEVQMLLLEKGADVSAKDNNGNTPLIYAATVKDFGLAFEMAQNLFDFGDPLPDYANGEQKTAMDYALAAGNETLGQFLVGKMGRG
ncbi:ankyrin repeat domain-containing protein [Breznakiella homolactica]|uniref:Ankyrin repeat domain-containing protein n=1 Tax=Breznakiella homolactica TaxID=2798577 RepID=A0A7T7XJJ2_9SPIR|nr:ankyrin repeat domain-containing protein [Breznakiella homolactica]QQO07584.1 ankyrin repeat domain-containing protein [Breznakiella homolactica]